MFRYLLKSILIGGFLKWGYPQNIQKTKTHGFERFPHAEKPALIIYGTMVI